MYYLTVGSIFKNEAHILKEWLNHYIFHGVEKFYLINDNSNDNFMEILQPYLDDGIVELYNANEPKYDGRQACLYVKYFLPKLKNKEMKWLAILDLDEFLYSPLEADIRKILKNCENIGQIHVDWINFGSNGHEKQPENVVESFTKCDILKYEVASGPKNIINSDFYTVDLGVHESHVYGPRMNLSWRYNIDNPPFIINHYRIQSLEFWKNIKMKRGDADCHLKDDERDMKMFHEQDTNIEEDLRLYQQNKLLQLFPLKKSNKYTLELPQNTFHSFCKNLKGGSKYGTDGILQYLIDNLDFDKKKYLQFDIDDYVTLPCLYSSYKNSIGTSEKRWNGIIHKNSNVSIPYGSAYLKISEDNLENLDNIPKGYDIVACNLKLFEKYNIDYYCLSDPVVFIIKLEYKTVSLKDFLNSVKIILSKKYTPVAFCKNIIICINSMHVKVFNNFPVIIGYKETDYLDLYTNLYYNNEEWCYDKEMEEEISKRNFYKKFGKFPKTDGIIRNNNDLEWIKTHISKNKSMLWKPLIL